MSQRLYEVRETQIMLVAAEWVVEEGDLKDRWWSGHVAALSLDTNPSKDWIPGRRDLVKCMCDAIAKRIHVIFDKVDGLLDLRGKDEKKATESETRPKSPMEMNMGVLTSIGLTLTWIAPPLSRIIRRVALS